MCFGKKKIKKKAGIRTANVLDMNIIFSNSY